MLSARVTRGDGRVVDFVGDGNWNYTPSLENNDVLLKVSGGYIFRDASASTMETYDLSGKLISIAYATGKIVTLTYSTAQTTSAPGPGYLVSAQDNFGRLIEFVYGVAPSPSLGLLLQVKDTGGAQVGLTYQGGVLTRVDWPDGKSRQFLYEPSSFVGALTGVVDENGARMSTFSYDAQGRAQSTERAGGVGRYSVSYVQPPVILGSVAYVPPGIIRRTYTWQVPDTPTIVDPLLSSSSLKVTLVSGTPKVQSQSQVGGSGCDSSMSTQDFDSRGNAKWKNDFNHRRTCYAYNQSRNLEEVRVEGLEETQQCNAVTDPNVTLPAGSRKVSTQWHPDWRLRSRVAEPGRITTYVYNGRPDPTTPENTNPVFCPGDGVTLTTLPGSNPLALLCRQIEEATTDLDGRQGFGATRQASVPKRVRSWKYNADGQVLEEKDPLGNVTSYEYYTVTDFTADPNAGHTKGDLKKLTTAIPGVKTDYDKYNKAGKVLQTRDSNNVVTSYTYDARQRLVGMTVGGRTTTHAYWPTGLLRRVTQPDGSYVEHEYDDAHRLKASVDNLGNRIDYELDPAGNRKAERVSDPNGVLKRQLSRTFDALGRIEKTTGRE